MKEATLQVLVVVRPLYIVVQHYWWSLALVVAVHPMGTVVTLGLVVQVVLVVLLENMAWTYCIINRGQHTRTAAVQLVVQVLHKPHRVLVAYL